MTSGLLLVDKPAGMTSHDVVSRVRRLAGTRKVGHAGTLDPAATGLLILGINAGTKLLQYVTGTNKSYDATIRLGISTRTDDAEGETVDAFGAESLTDEQLEAAMVPLRGPIQQVPTTVSAIKVDGKRAYARARAGEDVVLKPRPVTIGRFERTSAQRFDQAEGVAVTDFDVTVDCSSGTYIRALARDLGRSLGTGGHLTALRRTQIGPWTVEDALTLGALESLAGQGALPIIPLSAAALTLFPELRVTEDAAARFRHGAAPDAGEVVGPPVNLDALSSAHTRAAGVYAVTCQSPSTIAGGEREVLGLVRRSGESSLDWETVAVYPAETNKVGGHHE